MSNITPEIQEALIVTAITFIAIQLTLLLLMLIFHIREKKTGKPNPLNKEWP